MPRASNNVQRTRRRKKVLKQARGYRGGRHRLYIPARETLERGLQFAYRDRRDRKRQFRKLWITRINAAAREHGLSYSRFIYGLKAAEIEIDRKLLAELAVNDPEGFAELAAAAKAKL
ncbi:MAG TPA: 50S ribosomal protein L20 [Gemmatimonadota bacterium]|jgi:large subunit ribosomal protein L20|nr:50S ribosomal protein L20 [Gemmatimonadota bacterium]